jgi:cytochrome b561
MVTAPSRLSDKRPPGYSGVAKALHWTVALLLVASFAAALLMPDIRPGIARTRAMDLHFSVGVTIFMLMTVRLAWRLTHPVPLDPSDGPAWQRGVARLTYAVMYMALLAGPLLGWAAANARGFEAAFFGWSLPNIAGFKAPWGLAAGDVHALGMWTLLGVVGLHVSAALYHRFVRRDGVLARMLPATGRRA